MLPRDRALAAVFMLVLSTAPAAAQNAAPTPIPEITGSLPDTRESVARDAIRVPAFGTAQPTAMTLASAKPRKRIPAHRIVAIDAPPPVYWRPIHPRLGYGYGPGIRLYRW